MSARRSSIALTLIATGLAALAPACSTPTGGYEFDSALVVRPDSVVLVRARPITCVTGITVSLYAKLQVLAVDTSAAARAGGGRRIDLKILSDQNCGYRGLEPGLPKQ